MEGKNTIMNKKTKKREERKQYIFALKQMVSREIKRKYARSYLGIVWSVLNPLMMMAVMSMIFTTIFKRQIENFPIYYLTGQIIFGFFSDGTNHSMGALVDNKNLLIKVKLPKQIFVISRVLTELANLGYTLIAYVVMLVVFKVQPSIYMVLFVYDIILLSLFVLGIGYVLSIIYVHFGDIKHLYSVALRLLMYMSAIFFPVESVAPVLRRVIEINPVYAYIAFARTCVMNGQIPEPKLWIQTFTWGFCMFVVGYFVFRKKENTVMQKV